MSEELSGCARLTASIASPDPKAAQIAKLLSMGRRIRALRAQLVRREQESRDIAAENRFATTSDHRVLATRMLLDAAQSLYVDESERMLSMANVVPISRALAESTRILELAKELGVAPSAAFRIARAAVAERR